TLATTKHMECFTYFRPLLADGGAAAAEDVDPILLRSGTALYRPEVSATAHRLPELRPSTLYLFGGDSDVNPPAVRREKLELTGTGVGGSGGVKAGRVAAATLAGHGHLVALEAPGWCAEEIARFVAGEGLER